MVQKRYSDEDILKLLREIELNLASGSVEELRQTNYAHILELDDIAAYSFDGQLQKISNIGSCHRKLELRAFRVISSAFPCKRQKK